jgi:hypothetical protein
MLKFIYFYDDGNVNEARWALEITRDTFNYIQSHTKVNTTKLSLFSNFRYLYTLIKNYSIISQEEDKSILVNCNGGYCFKDKSCIVLYEKDIDLEDENTLIDTIELLNM